MYKRFVLDNGLILVTNKTASKKVVLLVGVKVGSIDEDKRVSGINHFIEHMLFRSNPHNSDRQIKEILESGGADTNALSGPTDMFFYIKALSSKLPDIIEIIYQAATNLDFDKREFLMEKNNILSETHLCPEQPMDHAYEDLFIPTLFRQTPLENPVAGTPESVRALEVGDLIDFKKTWYVPNNMIVAVCGGFDEEKLREQISSTFEKLQPKLLPARNLDIEIKNERREIFEKKQDIKHAYMHLGYRIPGILISKDIYKLEVLASILGGGMSSRLFYELRDKRGIGYVVNCSTGQLGKIGEFSVNLSLFNPTPKRFQMTLEVILDEFKKLKKDLVDEKEFQRAKDLILSGYYDEIEKIEYKALDMLTAELLGVSYREIRKFPRHIQGVSSRAVRSMAKKYLTSGYTLTALVPGNFKI